MELNLPLPTTTILLTGDLTIDRISQARNQLQEALLHQAEQGVIALDLSGVAECDGSGLQLLLAFARATDAGGSTVTVTNLPITLAQQLTEFAPGDLLAAIPTGEQA